MKKILTTCCCVGVGLMVRGNAVAVVGACMANMCLEPEILNTVPLNCKSYTSYCYNGYQVYECKACNSGYNLTSGTPIIVSGCPNTVDPKKCVADCVETDCDDETWAAFRTGYQVYKTKTWDADACECTTTQSYQCAAGYYGTANCITNPVTGSSVCSGCKACPSGGVYTDSAMTTAATPGCLPGNGTTATSCYLAPGTYYDASGAFTISGGFVTSCTYSE